MVDKGTPLTCDKAFCDIKKGNDAHAPLPFFVYILIKNHLVSFYLFFACAEQKSILVCEKVITLIALISEERIILHSFVHLLTYSFDDLLILWISQNLVDQVSTEQHHIFLATTGCHGCSTETKTTCLEC